jgi:hypothetical protein
MSPRCAVYIHWHWVVVYVVFVFNQLQFYLYGCWRGRFWGVCITTNTDRGVVVVVSLVVIMIVSIAAVSVAVVVYISVVRREGDYVSIALALCSV